MLSNYLKTALRNLGRYRVFSCINVVGLAVGKGLDHRAGAAGACPLAVDLVAGQPLGQVEVPQPSR